LLNHFFIILVNECQNSQDGSWQCLVTLAGSVLSPLLAVSCHPCWQAIYSAHAIPLPTFFLFTLSRSFRKSFFFFFFYLTWAPSPSNHLECKPMTGKAKKIFAWSACSEPILCVCVCVLGSFSCGSAGELCASGGHTWRGRVQEVRLALLQGHHGQQHRT